MFCGVNISYLNIFIIGFVTGLFFWSFMLYGVLLHRHCVVKIPGFNFILYLYPCCSICLPVWMHSYPPLSYTFRHIRFAVEWLWEITVQSCPSVSPSSCLQLQLPLLSVYMNNNLRTIEATLWNILEKSMRKLFGYFVYNGQFERCFMKSCAFLHTCTIHLHWIVVLWLRNGETTNYLEHQISGGVKIPLLFLLMFIS